MNKKEKITKDEICVTCRFSHVVTDEDTPDKTKHGWIECRKNSPRILHGSGNGWSDQEFPYMKHYDWCGEFEAIKEASK